MELSLDTLEKIIGTSARWAAGDPRRRRAARMRISIQGYRYPAGEPLTEPEPVRIFDLSPAGVGFLDSQAIAIGQEIGLCISRRDGSLLSVICAVKHSQSLKKGRYKLGAAYIRLDESRPPVKKPVTKPKSWAHENRRARRVAHEKQVEIRICRDAGLTGPVKVIMQDLSARGVGLVYTQQLAKGEQFILRVRTPDGQFKQMLYTVAHCRKIRDRRFLVGAEFTCVAPNVAA